MVRHNHDSEKQEYREGMENQSPENLSVFDEALSTPSERVSQVVGTNPAEESRGNASSNGMAKDLSFFDSVSHRINRLLTSSDSKASFEKMTRKEQEQVVYSYLKKEQDELIQESRKIENSRYFSASKFEKVLQRIRILQQTMSELIDMTFDQLQSLYNRYILKR